MNTSKPPVILQVLPALKTGGVERGTIEITRAIAKAGWKPIVASSGGPLAPSIAYAGGEHVTLPLDSKNPIRMALNVLALEKLIKEKNVSLIHARSRAPAWSAYYAAKRAGCHFVTTVHGIYGLQNEWKKRYNSIMTKGELVIAVSRFVAEHISANYQTSPRVIRIIHRGVDPKQFHPSRVHPERMAELARKWQVPEHLPVILFPGRVTRWKGQDVFVEALAKLPHRHFLALLVGDDSGHEEFRQEIEARITKLGLEGHVRFVGATTNMAEAYTLSRFVVATSLEPEAFGRVVLEAQAMGRPVIATNHGGACETVEPAVTGWLVEPGNVEALTRQIDYALNINDDIYYEMSVAAQQNSERFSADSMCDQTLNVYKEVLSPKADAASW